MNFELVSFRVELGFEGENEKRLAFGASHEKVDNLERFRMLFKDNESFAIFSGEKNEFAEVRNEGPFIIKNAEVVAEEQVLEQYQDTSQQGDMVSYDEGYDYADYGEGEAEGCGGHMVEAGADQDKGGSRKQIVNTVFFCDQEIRSLE